MSVAPTSLTAEHFAYIESRGEPEDEFLRSLREEAEAAGIPAISIGYSQARFMQILLRLAGARTVVEVGTLAGYSAIAMARALPAGGRVLTIELDPGRAAFARRKAAESDVPERVVVLDGRGDELLARMEDASADAAFLDADKGGYPAYLEQCMRIVRPGGLVMADNAFAFGELFAKEPGDPETPAVRAFNEIMAARAGLRSIIVPLGDGLWVGVKDPSPMITGP